MSAAPRIALSHRGWLFDLDGTVYLGERLIPGADEVIAALRADGRRVAFLSNKPLFTRRDYADKLTRLGIPAVAEDVVNSSIAAYYYLRVIIYMYMREPEGEGLSVAPSLAGGLALSIALIGLVLLGLMPAPFADLAQAAVTPLLR